MTITTAARRLALVGTFAILASLLAIAPAAAQADTYVDLDADDNVSASVTWSQYTFDAADEVLIGREDLFADNLASGVLQGQGGGRPLLLTPSDALDASVAAEITRLGATTAHVLGGEAAISADVADELEGAGLTVNRIEGPTRIETAIAAASLVDSDTVIVARGFADDDPTQAFADSLAAGAWAADSGFPVLLTQTEVLTGNTAAALTDGGYTNAFVVGGEAAISAETFDAINEIVPAERIAGDTRFETAVAIAAERGFASADDAAVTVLTDGQGENAWADGFSAAAYAAINDAPVVLSNSASEELPAETLAFLEGAAFAQDATPTALDPAVGLVCGPSVPDSEDPATEPDQCDDAAAALGLTNRTEFPETVPPGPTPNETGTSAPELVIAETGDLVTAVQATASNPKGLRVIYTFDEAVAAVDFNQFHVWNTAATAEIVATSASIDPTDPTKVIAIFGTLDTQTLADSVVLATVDDAAVTDFQGAQNSESQFEIGTAEDASGGAAGITNAPDLLTVSGFRQGATNTTTAVDLTFDENTFASAALLGNFMLIPTDGSAPRVLGADPLDVAPAPADTTTPSGGNAAGGNGTTTLTVLFVNTAPGTFYTAAQFARGVIQADVVGDGAGGTGNLNTLQAADISANGNTLDPDLVSATFQPDVTSGGLPFDGVVYNFDNPALAPVAANFQIYNHTPVEILGSASGIAPQATGNQVLVYYPDGSLADAVGAAVKAGAVTGNEADEVGVQNDFVTSRTPGEVAAPQLTDVTISLNSPIIGTPSYQIAYTFDVDVDGVVPGAFWHVTSAGARTAGTTCAVGTTEDTDNVVTCTAFGALTSDAIGAGILGTVDNGAVDVQGASTLDNVEGGLLANGSTGTPAQ